MAGRFGCSYVKRALGIRRVKCCADCHFGGAPNERTVHIVFASGKELCLCCAVGHHALAHRRRLSFTVRLPDLGPAKRRVLPNGALLRLVVR